MSDVLARVFAILFALLIGAGAAAQGLDGFVKIYDEPTDVNLGGRPVVADIAFYADLDAAKRGDLRLALVTDVTEFIEQTERDLENWIAAHQERCGERWRAGDPYIGFPPGMIRFALYLELEMWNCGWKGEGEPGKFAHESGEVDVTLDPYIEDGKLQAGLAAFSIDERSGISRYLPLEFVVRRVLRAELEKLNQNPKFYRAPMPLYDEDFRYHSIGARKKGERVVITAQYRAEGPADTLDRLVERVRREGITQERRAQ